MSHKKPKGGHDENKPDLYEQFEELNKTRIFHQSMEERLVEFEIIRRSPKPIAYIFIGDTHIGARGVHYDKILELIKFLDHNRNFKVVFMGDLYDNFLHFNSLRGANDSVSPPSIQIEHTVDMLNHLDSNDQLEGIVLGNHTIDREEKAVGYSVLKKAVSPAICKKIFEGVGEIKLNFGKDKRCASDYRIVVSHKGFGSSAANPCHAAMVLARRWNYPDVAMTAHCHRPAICNFWEANREIVAGRTGTFKIEDAHSERYYCKGIVGTPCVVFYPDHYEKLGTMYPHRALEWM